MTRPSLSVIMPVYNEVQTIREIINRVMESPVDKEILIVDDCSKDGTREILKDLEKSNLATTGNNLRFFFHEKNQGKGAAIRRARNEAVGMITIIQDADLEVNPMEYPTIIKPILDGNADVVYGSRFHPSMKRSSLTWHTLGNRLLTFVSNVFTGLRLTDMETCYKAFGTDLFKSIPLDANRFDFEPEITARIAKRKCRITEVPISYQQRSRAEGKKIGFKDAFHAVLTTIKYSFKRDT